MGKGRWDATCCPPGPHGGGAGAGCSGIGNGGGGAPSGVAQGFIADIARRRSPAITFSSGGPMGHGRFIDDDNDDVLLFLHYFASIKCHTVALVHVYPALCFALLLACVELIFLMLNVLSVRLPCS